MKLGISKNILQPEKQRSSKEKVWGRQSNGMNVRKKALSLLLSCACQAKMSDQKQVVHLDLSSRLHWNEQARYIARRFATDGTECVLLVQS